MALNLQTFASGDTDYITKHNSNNSAIQAQSNTMLQDVEALKAAGAPGADLDYRLLSTNLIVNGGFDFWQRGASTRPDVWTIENDGAGFAVTQSTAQLKYNTYSVKTVNQGQLTQSLPSAVLKGFDSSFSISFGAWVYAETASKARVGIYDGVTTQYSSYHTGSSTWEFLAKNYVQGSGTVPSEIKFVLDNAGDTVYFNSVVCIRGNSSSSPVYIANDPVLETMRVFGYIEKGFASVAGIGRLVEDLLDREIITTIRFTAPKISTPTITLEDPETSFDFAAENIDQYGFDLVVAEIDGLSGTNGFEYRNIEWTAEI